MSRASLTRMGAFLLPVLLSAPAMAQDTKQLWRGEALAAPCFGCHAQRQSGDGIPRLDEPEEVAEEMREFRSGTEQGTIMGRIAKAFTDDEIRLLDQYFRHLAGGERQ